jgi:hypothetical protein
LLSCTLFERAFGGFGLGEESQYSGDLVGRVGRMIFNQGIGVLNRRRYGQLSDHLRHHWWDND